jgi:polar amino acid transport system substrate-binding protein
MRFPALLMFAALCAAGPAGYAGDLRKSVPPPELIVYSGVIPPYSYLDGTTPKGIAVELFQEMAKLVGHSGKIQFLPWKRAVKTVEDAHAQPAMILPLNRSPERERRFSWVVPLLKDETALVTKKGVKPKLEDPKTARKWSVGVLLGSPLEAELKLNVFEHVTASPDEETNAKMLHIERLDAWFVATMVAPFVYKRLGYDPKELEVGVKMQVNDLHLGATKELPEAEARKWRDAWETLVKEGRVEKLLAEYRL